jgi:hypothetical protein
MLSSPRLRSAVAAVAAAGIAIVPIALAAGGSPPVNTVKPALSGIARDGQTLTTTAGTWSGTPPITFTYQWLRCDPVTWACPAIANATGSTYTLKAADVGYKLQSAVTATNADGQSTARSYASAVIAAVAPANTTKPALSGIARDGQTLTTTTGTWSGTPPITFTYQWLRCHPVTWVCTTIPGQTGQSYALTAADVGFKLQSAVNAANAAGQATAKSYASATVAAAAPANTAKPALSGAAKEGQTLTTTAGTWSGTPPITYAYQWLRCNALTWVCATIPGQTAQTYSVVAADVGSRIVSSVTATNVAGQATVRSYGSAVVAPAAPVGTIPGAPNCPVFPADNPWNTRVDTLPVATNSATIINSIGASTGLHPDFGSGLWQGQPIGIPYDVVPGTTPTSQVEFDYAGESDPGPYPIPNPVKIEGGSDHHALIVDKDSCTLYELFDLQTTQTGWHAGSGAIWSLRSNALRPEGWTSADAAGLPILPGLARYEEVAAGHIEHALRFTVSHTRRAYIYPARHFASSSNDPSLPPMGLRVRLKAGFDISGFPPQARVILQTLKTYGMMVADNGSNWYISGAPDPGWSNDDLHTLGQVPGSAFEVVDTSSLAP